MFNQLIFNIMCYANDRNNFKIDFHCFENINFDNFEKHKYDKKSYLAPWLFFLSEPQGKKREAGDFDNLETNSWKITN